MGQVPTASVTWALTEEHPHQVPSEGHGFSYQPTDLKIMQLPPYQPLREDPGWPPCQRTLPTFWWRRWAHSSLCEKEVVKMHADQEPLRIWRPRSFQKPRLCQWPAWFHSPSQADPAFHICSNFLLSAGFLHPWFISLFHRLLIILAHLRSCVSHLTSQSAMALSSCFCCWGCFCLEFPFELQGVEGFDQLSLNFHLSAQRQGNVWAMDNLHWSVSHASWHCSLPQGLWVGKFLSKGLLAWKALWLICLL